MLVIFALMIKFSNEQEPNDEIIKSGVNPDNIRKWKVFVFNFFNVIRLIFSNSEYLMLMSWS